MCVQRRDAAIRASGGDNDGATDCSPHRTEQPERRSAGSTAGTTGPGRVWRDQVRLTGMPFSVISPTHDTFARSIRGSALGCGGSGSAASGGGASVSAALGSASGSGSTSAGSPDHGAQGAGGGDRRRCPKQKVGKTDAWLTDTPPHCRRCSTATATTPRRAPPGSCSSSSSSWARRWLSPMQTSPWCVSHRGDVCTDRDTHRPAGIVGSVPVPRRRPFPRRGRCARVVRLRRWRVAGLGGVPGEPRGWQWGRRWALAVFTSHLHICFWNP